MAKMIELSNHDEIRAHQRAKRLQIAEAFEKAQGRTARLITKAEFDEEYPSDTYERYSLQALNKFREDLHKAEGVDDPDLAFKTATANLKSFVVQDGEGKAIAFVRKKEKGE